MSIYKTTSSKVIIRKIFRDLKPSSDNWIDDAIEWIGEALEHIGSAPQLSKKQCVLTVTDHKVLLPTDLYYINQVAVNNTVSPVNSKEVYNRYSMVQVIFIRVCTVRDVSMKILVMKILIL